MSKEKLGAAVERLGYDPVCLVVRPSIKDLGRLIYQHDFGVVSEVMEAACCNGHQLPLPRSEVHIFHGSVQTPTCYNVIPETKFS